MAGSGIFQSESLAVSFPAWLACSLLHPQSTGVPFLEVIGVTKSFGHVIAVADVDLALSAGEVVALVGDWSREETSRRS